MTTLSFYARGDGSSANNAALNVENQSQQQTVLLTFDSGTSGDLILGYNGGATDPDTTVIINGISYSFNVELTGVLPLGNPKTPDPLEGKTVTVISVDINGSIERFFFVNDGSGTLALMNGFGNGAIALTNVTYTPPPVHICFCGGTKILTPTGYQEVAALEAGDLVLTDAGQAKPIVWVGRSEVTLSELLRAPERWPVCIAAHAIAPGVPSSDLLVSAQHRVVLADTTAELLFGEERVLVAAKHLVGLIADWVKPVAAVTYHHILLERHDMLMSNGLATESLQPSIRSFAGISHEAQRSLADAVPDGALPGYFRRQDALRSLKPHEARVLAERMFGRTTNLHRALG